MPYSGSRDPRLIKDLVTALRRWQKATLENVELGRELRSVERRMARDPDLGRAVAVRHTLRAALDWLRSSGHADDATLLERHHILDQAIPVLCEMYNAGERTLYYRLEQATAELAEAVWILESVQPGPVARTRQSSATSPAERTRHLPVPTYSRLFGVDRVLSDLMDRLRDPGDHWLISIEGMGGLGKTALAREAALRLASTGWFDGVAWVAAKQEIYTARGLQRLDRPDITLEQVLDTIAEQLDPGGRRPLSVADKRDHVKRLLRSGSYLVVVDNLEAAQDNEVLPGELWELANPAKLLLTSRHRVGPGATEWMAVSSLSLDRLAEADALALLRHEMGLRGLGAAQAQEEELQHMVAATGGHPLAIKLAAGQLVSLSLARVVDSLQTLRSRNDLFDFLYRPSWERLPAGAREVMFLMALLPSGGIVWDDLAPLSKMPAAELDGAIDELTARSLLQAGGLRDKVYTIHPLTRRFVASQPEQEGDVEGRAVRIGRHFLSYVQEHVGDWGALAGRQEHILHGIELCVAMGPEGKRVAVQCARLLGKSMQRQGRLAAWLPYLQMAIDAAGELGDEAAQAELWNHHGMLIGVEGDLSEALALHQQAARVFERLGDHVNLASTLRLLGNVHFTQANRRAALACYEQARDLLLELPAPEPRELSRIYHNIACVHGEDQEWPQALSFYEQAAALVDPELDRPLLTILLANLSELRWEMGCWRQAVADLNRALPLQEEAGDLVGQITSHHYLCLCHASLGERDEARGHAQRGLLLSTILGSNNTRAHLCTDLAAAFLDMGQDDDAQAYLALAEPLWRQLGQADGVSRVRAVMGDLFRRAGVWDKAEAAYHEALLLLEDRRDHDPRRVKAWLGLVGVRLDRGDCAGAEAFLSKAWALAGKLGRPDFQVRVLWLRAELYPGEARQALQAAVELCGPPGAGNDRLDILGTESRSRLADLGE